MHSVRNGIGSLLLVGHGETSGADDLIASLASQ
jgi:hypothetical protein